MNFFLVGAHGGFVRVKDLSYELTTCHVTYCTRNTETRLVNNTDWLMKPPLNL